VLRIRAGRAIGAALVLAAYAAGGLTYRNGWPPLGTVRRLRHRDPTPTYFSDLSVRTTAPCPPADARTAVVLALGQSNAANWAAADSPVDVTPGVVTFFDGRCYVPADPLLGSDGMAHSIWPLVAADWVVDRAFDRVVIVPFAIGSTSIADWDGKPFFARRLDTIAADLHRAGLRPTAIVWFQGETDTRSQTAGETYISRFTSFYRTLRQRGWSAPLYLSLTTRCQGAPNVELRAAQRTLQSLDGIRPGPDTDALGYAYRWDGCHFTSEGRTALARLWADAIARP
jgi:hypothetical protein